MLLSVLLQAAAAGVGLSKLGAALGAGLAVIEQVSVLVRSVARPWKVLRVNRRHREISV